MLPLQYFLTKPYYMKNKVWGPTTYLTAIDLMENGKQSLPQMAKALTWGKCQALKAIFQINKHPVSVSHKALEGKMSVRC